MSVENPEQSVDVVAEVKKLELPHGEYVVFGSGLLSALKIRRSKDVDIIVSSRMFEELKKSGWNYSEVDIAGRKRQKLSRGNVEVFSQFWGNDGVDVDVTKWIQEAQLIDGVAFPSNEDFVLMKRLLGREKDLQDVALFKKYLSER